MTKIKLKLISTLFGVKAQISPLDPLLSDEQKKQNPLSIWIGVLDKTASNSPYERFIERGMHKDNNLYANFNDLKVGDEIVIGIKGRQDLRRKYDVNSIENETIELINYDETPKLTEWVKCINHIAEK
jgi:hypothetical protein